VYSSGSTSTCLSHLMRFSHLTEYTPPGASGSGDGMSLAFSSILTERERLRTLDVPLPRRRWCDVLRATTRGSYARRLQVRSCPMTLALAGPADVSRTPTLHPPLRQAREALALPSRNGSRPPPLCLTGTSGTRARGMKKVVVSSLFHIGSSCVTSLTYAQLGPTLHRKPGRRPLPLPLAVRIHATSGTGTPYDRLYTPPASTVTRSPLALAPTAVK
jgi:hypothetical protein